MKKFPLFLSFFILLGITSVFAQNITITDDENHTADESAVLDVYSTSKGMLIPRMTTEQREGVANPAQGLLVFDVDTESFFFHNGSNWSDLSNGGSDAWIRNGSTNSVYLSQNSDKVGIGTSSPEALFEVRNSAGDPVFAVYPEGVRMYVKEGEVENDKSGFVVSGQGVASANEMFRLTSDSARIYFDEPVKGSRGGFAVGNTGAIKGEDNNVFEVYSEGVRMYVNEGEVGGENSGFVVSGQGTLSSKEMLRITRDSARIYVDEQAKGSRGGFAVGNTGAIKGVVENIMYIEEENFFIGKKSGASISTGIQNSFLGFETGKNNTTGSNNFFAGFMAGSANEDGSNNIFFGNNAGISNISGVDNIIIGNEAGVNSVYANSNLIIGRYAGYKVTNGFNTFIGTESGANSENVRYNTFVGRRSGMNNISGEQNTYMGFQAGAEGTIGVENTYIGTSAGRQANGSYNVYIGSATGGYGALNENTGSQNVFVGNNSGIFNLSGEYNSFFGYKSGEQNTFGNYNTFVGAEAGIANTNGIRNTYLGLGAGQSNTSGSRSVYLGAFAGGGLTDGDRNIIIGYGANQSATSDSDLLYIGNLDADFAERCFIRGEFDNNYLQLNTVYNGTEGKVNINDVMQLTPRSTVPASAAEGDMYYDGVNHKLKIHNGSEWKNVSFE